MKLSRAVFLFVLVACSSDPKSSQPAWTNEPTRIVDNGYIIYVGKAEATQPERAQFEAEGQALEDLANECSMIPKDTRVEDRFVSQDKYLYTAYVKIGLEFKDCDEMKRTVNPDEIKRLASVPFTQQLKKYQDLVESGEMIASSDVDVPKEIEPPPAPGSGGVDHFYVTRQYVAYQKEIVILSPPTAYAVNSPESQSFVRTMQPVSNNLASTEAANPGLKNNPQPWSQVPNRPSSFRPRVLSSAARDFSAHHPMKSVQSPAHGDRKRNGPPGGRRGRRHARAFGKER